jgi:hypothetical protein
MRDFTRIENRSGVVQCVTIDQQEAADTLR